MNLRFIANAVVDPHVITIALDPTKRLLWRPEPLQEALRLLDIYDDFTNNGLRGAPQQLALVLKRVALDQLKKNVQDLVASAQQFQPRAVTRTQANLDADTVPEVNSFRDATELLLQLATRLQPLGAMETRNSIMQVMIRQADGILHTLNDRLDADHPYFAKPGNWTGSGSVAQASYEVRNAQGLADYLTAQRNRIKFLEQQSEPLVPFLNQWLPMRGEQENQLITTWEQIIQDFHDYDAKRPGASLAGLEDFIVNDMDKIVPENACGEKLGAGSGAADDFFVEVRNNLRIDTSQRCRVVSAADVCKSYTTIASAFNEKLAGKFPFARLATGKTPQEQVAPEAIAEFYSLYDADEKMARSTLNLDSRFGTAARPALQFLDAIAALRPLVFPASADAGKEPALTLDFVPAFRTNRAAELDGNQIIDWTLQVGGQIFRQREPEHPGRWRPGNPVRLSLRWANDSVYMPDFDGQPELHIRGDRNAFFEFTTRWPLFGFLRRYEAPPSETAQSGENQPYTLRFHVRTKRDPKWAVDPSAPQTARRQSTCT